MNVLDIQNLLDYSFAPLMVAAVWAGAFLLSQLVSMFFKQPEGEVPSRIKAKMMFFLPMGIWFLACGVLLQVFGVNFETFIQVFAAGSLIIGLVLTPAGSQAIAGFLNITGDVFRLGEVLEVDGVVGRVVKKGMMSTRVETIDGSMYDIPNKLLFDSIVHNFTRVQFFRVVADIHIDDGNFDLLKTESVLNSVIAGKERWNKYDEGKSTTREAEVRFHEIAGSSYVFKVIAWIDDRMKAEKRHDELLRECVIALDAAGISYGQTTNISSSDGIPVRIVPGEAEVSNHEVVGHRNHSGMFLALPKQARTDYINSAAASR